MTSVSDVARNAVYPLSPLELAAGIPLGVEAGPTGLPDLRGRTLRTAVQDAIAAEMTGGLVFVSFSGGRDSSMVLAFATLIARRQGLPDPVPITIRVADSEDADESQWQELVMRHLRLSDWTRIRVTDELGILGPVALRVLHRHGLIFPPNGYVHDLMAEHARNGVLLTGAGGDELLDQSYAHRHAMARHGEVRWTPRIAAAVAVSTALPFTHRRLRARSAPKLPWLRRRAQARFARQLSRADPPPVRGWAAGVAQLSRYRSMRALQLGQAQIASARQTRIVHPLLDPSVIAAAAAEGGWRGLGGRNTAMRVLTAGLLPDELAVRDTKASFADAVWTSDSRAQLHSGVLLEAVAADQDLRRLVDLNALRQEWLSPSPHFSTASLVHAAYLATR